jgi:hypothetical protein
MNERFFRRTLPALVVTVGLTVAGVVIGRALHGRSADERPAGSLEVRSAQVASGASTVVVPVIEPVLSGANPPASPDPDDESFGLGRMSGVMELDLSSFDGDVPVLGPAVEGESVDFSTPAAPPEGGWEEPVVIDDGAGVPGVVPPAVAESIAALDPFGEADDGGEEGAGGSPTSEGSSLIRVLDPCAPLEGVAGPVGCPAGQRSTVLALTSPPELYMWAVPGLAEIPAWVSFGSCPGGPAAADELLVTMVANAPGTFQVVARDVPSGAEVARAEVTTLPATRERWEAYLSEASPGANPRAFEVVHCARVPGLEAGPVSFTVDLVDIFDRRATAEGLAQIGPDPVRPPTVVLPVSNSSVYVNVPHRADQSVDIRSWVSDGSSECDGRGREIRFGGRREVDVPLARLQAANFDPSYTRRTWQLIPVADSSTVTICMLTYDSTGPSFRQTRPARTEVAVVRAPDMVLPVATVEGVEITQRLGRRDLEVDLSIVGAGGCGGYAGEFTADARVVERASRSCDYSLLRNPAHAHRLLVVQTRVIDAGRTAESTAGLGVRGLACSGPAARPCPEPPTSWYRVPLGTVSLPAGLCSPGLFETSCEPPRRNAVAGTALVRVEWMQGASSGEAGWNVVRLPELDRDTTLDPVPQLDVNTVWEVRGTDLEPVLAARLVADRPVNWRFVIPDQVCTLTGERPVSTSAAPSTTFDVEVADLCTPQRVQFHVELTDPSTGVVTRWGASLDEDPWSARVWRGSHTYVPAPSWQMVVVLGASSAGGGDMWAPVGMAVRLGPSFINPAYLGYLEWPTPLVTDPRFRCNMTDYRRQVDLIGVSREYYGQLALPEQVVIEVGVTLQRMEGSWDNCRESGVPRSETVDFRVTVPREDLLAPGGVRIEAGEDAAFPVVLVIKPQR